jgi:hypothetical protein
MTHFTVGYVFFGQFNGLPFGLCIIVWCIIFDHISHEKLQRQIEENRLPGIVEKEVLLHRFGCKYTQNISGSSKLATKWREYMI